MDSSRTESVQIHEVCAGSGSALPEAFEGEPSITRTSRGYSPYFIAAWVIALISTGVGTLWLLGLLPRQSERYANPYAESYGSIVTLDVTTGRPLNATSTSSSTALGNLTEIAPSLFLIGLCGILALLIVQGFSRQKR